MEELPVEVLEQIFKQLSRLEDVKNCFNTCIKWGHIIENMFKENGKTFLKVHPLIKIKNFGILHTKSIFKKFR